MIQLDLFEEVREILMALLDVEASEIMPESYLVRDLGVESIDFLELAVVLNERFQIVVHDNTAFLHDLRLDIAQAEEQGRAQIEFLQKQYRFLPKVRLEAILSDLESGPVIQVQDIMGYVQWQMMASKAA